MKLSRWLSVISVFAILSAQSVQAQTEEVETENPYKRKPSTFAIGAEIGMNSLSSLVGINASLLTVPRWAFDAGLGLGMNGLRTGFRGRYFFSDAKFAPFAGLALKQSSGTGGYSDVKVTKDKEETIYRIKSDPATFTDFSVGIDYKAHTGFNLIVSLGYSYSFTGKNWKADSIGPIPTDDAKTLFDFIYGSGLLLGVNLGWAF